jgi:hypothetical protein
MDKICSFKNLLVDDFPYKVIEKHMCSCMELVHVYRQLLKDDIKTVMPHSIDPVFLKEYPNGKYVVKIDLNEGKDPDQLEKDKNGKIKKDNF